MIKWRKTTIKHVRFKLEQIPVPGGTTSSQQMHDPRNMCRRQMPQKSRGDTPIGMNMELIETATT